MDQFDGLLFSVSEDVVKELPKIEKRIFPLKTMFSTIIWALFFQMTAHYEVFTFFGILEGFMLFIQPVIASVLLQEAFYVGYSENKYFKRAYWFQWINTIFCLGILVIYATPFWEIYFTQLEGIKMIMPVVVNYLTIYNLAKAFVVLVPQAEQNTVVCERLQTVRVLIILEFIARYTYQNLSEYSYLTLGMNVILICIYIKAFKELQAVKNLIEYYAYSIMPVVKKKQRRHDWLLRLELIVTAIVVIWMVKTSDEVREPVNLIALEEETAGFDMEEVEEVREHLISLGMEAYIVNDLLPQDVMRFKKVKGILKSSRTEYLEHAGTNVKVTMYVGELLSQEKEVRSGDSLRVEGYYFDETLVYVEWPEDPKQAYGMQLEIGVDELDHENYYYELPKDRRFVQIAQKDGIKQYYEFNHRDGDQEQAKRYGSVLSSADGIFLKDATKYRCYSVQKIFVDEISTNNIFGLDIRVRFIKEQETYPFYSLFYNDRYFETEHWRDATPAGRIKSWNYALFDLRKDRDKDDCVYLGGVILRGIKEYVEDNVYFLEHKDDFKDDYNADRKYQQALYFYN